MKSLIMRAIILLATSLIVAGVVYVPVRLMPSAPERRPFRDEVNSKRIERALQERQFRDRQPTVFLGLRLIVNQLAGVILVAFVGRKVLRLSLRR
jgi:hypothetical protein